MSTLIKYKLDFDKTHKHILERLQNVNALSKTVVDYTPFKQGEFFTFLKKGLSEEMVHDFRNIHVAKGGMEKIATLLHKEVTSSKGKICIIDDFNEEYEAGNNWELYNEIGIHFEKEMYYVLTGKQSKDVYLKCLQESNTVWHGLCVLTNAPLKKNDDSSISLEELELICKQACMVLLVAYDAESYVVWKKLP